MAVLVESRILVVDKKVVPTRCRPGKTALFVKPVAFFLANIIFVLFAVCHPSMARSAPTSENCLESYVVLLDRATPKATADTRPPLARAAQAHSAMIEIEIAQANTLRAAA